MTDKVKSWDAAVVRTWLDRRCEASRLDQAAAEEWACRALKSAACTDDQAAFAARLKELIGQAEYPLTGLNDEIRFERHVRSYLRMFAKMTKANEGFEKTLHHQ